MRTDRGVAPTPWTAASTTRPRDDRLTCDHAADGLNSWDCYGTTVTDGTITLALSAHGDAAEARHRRGGGRLRVGPVVGVVTQHGPQPALDTGDVQQRGRLGQAGVAGLERIQDVLMLGDRPVLGIPIEYATPHPCTDRHTGDPDEHGRQRPVAAGPSHRRMEGGIMADHLLVVRRISHGRKMRGDLLERLRGHPPRCQGRHLRFDDVLYATDNSVVWAQPDGDLVDQPGQLRAQAVMGDVFGPFRTDKGAEVVAFREPFRHIEVDPDLRGGYPVVAESRVPYHLVASLVRDGVPPDAIREIYPSVDADGARDAVRMADYVDRRSRAA
jgi:uncharacterized protein (DUF433 family)